MREELTALREQALRDIAGAADSLALEQVRVAISGRSGPLTQAGEQMRHLPKEDRPEVGKLLHEVRTAITGALEARLQELREGLALRQVARVLKLYATALSGRDVAVRGIDEMETVDRFGPDHIILPADMRFFQDDDRNFTAYKVAAAHGAARIEFGTYRVQLDDVPETIEALTERYGTSSA
jgi:hypothetical protein